MSRRQRDLELRLNSVLDVLLTVPGGDRQRGIRARRESKATVFYLMT
jgi:hypothetical protein